MKMIAEKADTPYILLYTKTSALELAYKALERMTDFLQDRECGMVYADHHEWKNGERTVSYTHLDVYKRQSFNSSIGNFLCSANHSI